MIQSRFLTQAEIELDDVYMWYEQKEDGLGQRFLPEVEKVVHEIETHPSSGKVVFANTVRLKLIQLFPYALFYRLKNNDLIIIAVAHQHRKPGYWLSRV